MENDQEDDDDDKKAVLLEALRQQGNNYYKQGECQCNSLSLTSRGVGQYGMATGHTKRKLHLVEPPSYLSCSLSS